MRKTRNSNSKDKRNFSRTKDSKPKAKSNGNRNLVGDAPKTEDSEKKYSKKKQLEFKLRNMSLEEEMRLNKYIANSGICSRREADKMIADGRISVNGNICSEVGTKVSYRDNVCVDGKEINPEKKVYIIMNKPKNCVTSADDNLGRTTVMDIISTACPQRVFPVGRLDRMTTGVLLLTNDGDLTKKLTHPKYDKKKIYHAVLDKNITEAELEKIAIGFELEDGFIKSDRIEYANGKHNEVGIEIHSGKNRIVRRIFKHLGYEVVKLDRVFFGGLTKKGLPRGKFRFLTDTEIKILKNFK
ncbi:MAG: rRNA pseudouridine synthase [Marinifilaceae bacterium]|jgi:23S rRNA pseudouridine2605 synthase|nr:rRNA pseudouridine synthase [Marinifilaceae bacterium]